MNNNIFNDFLFGIEVELCVYLSNGEYDNLKSTDDYRLIRGNLHNDILNYFLTKKSIYSDISWEIVEPTIKEAIDYKNKKWKITNDSSVKCYEDGKYCIIKGTIEEKCPDISFCDIEIVSRILNTEKMEGLKELVFMWESYILSNLLTYLVNDTQGLHVHLSHPKLDLYKFLKVWFIYEPVINNIISPSRRKDKNSESSFCADLTCLTNYEKLKEKQKLTPEKKFNQNIKYYSVNVKYYTEQERRIEIRVYQGTAYIEEIYNWVLFCLCLADFSISQNDKNLDDLYEKNKDNYKKAYISLFTEVIRDINLNNYFIKKHNENKDENIPLIETYSNLEERFPIWHKQLSNEEWKEVEKLQII